MHLKWQLALLCIISGNWNCCACEVATGIVVHCQTSVLVVSTRSPPSSRSQIQTPFQADFLPAYAAYIREVIISAIAHPEHPATPLKGWHVVVNAGNGAGGFFADRILQPLGADTTGSIHLEPDGKFPAHIPNPEDKTAMGMTVDAVLRNNADLGIVFDTDVDRSGVVDADGTVINKNRYIALMAAITLRYALTHIVTACVLGLYDGALQL